MKYDMKGGFGYWIKKIVQMLNNFVIVSNYGIADKMNFSEDKYKPLTANKSKTMFLNSTVKDEIKY